MLWWNKSIYRNPWLRLFWFIDNNLHICRFSRAIIFVGLPHNKWAWLQQQQQKTAIERTRWWAIASLMSWIVGQIFDPSQMAYFTYKLYNVNAIFFPYFGWLSFLLPFPKDISGRLSSLVAISRRPLNTMISRIFLHSSMCGLEAIDRRNSSLSYANVK